MKTILFLREFFRAILGLNFLPAARATGSVAVPDPAPQSLTIEQQLEEARTSLSELQTAQATAAADLEAARADVTSLTTERDNLQSQFDALTTEATTLRADLEAARGSISTLTRERDTANNELTAARSNVTRLETLCGVKGVNPKAAVPVAPDGPGTDTESRIADLQARLADASPTEKADIARQIRKLRDEA